MLQRLVPMVTVCALAACASADDPLPPQAFREAACRSEAYLRDNGFLNSRPSDVSKIRPSWDDAVDVDAEGNFDLDALLRSRASTFSNKMVGVVRNGEELWVVYRYRRDYPLSCVVVGGGDVHLSHANCVVHRVVRLRQNELNCGHTG